MATEVDRIVDQMRRAFEGEAWHGPSLQELLTGIGADRAVARPLPGRHSIWELVGHIAAWKDVVRHRLAGEAMSELPPEENFPPASDPTPAGWKRMQDRLRESHERLVQAVASLSDDHLLKPVPGKQYDAYYLLHGVIQHDLYHTGQIALLR